MKPTIKMLGIALAASTVLSTGALAQREGSYGSTAPQTQPQARGGEQQKEKAGRGATVTIGDRKIKTSPAFTKAYQDLIAAIDANDTANISAKVAAAHAAAQTGDEHFLASQAQLKVAVAQKNDAEIATAIEALIASGSLSQDQLPNFYLNLAKTRYNLKQYPQSIAALEKTLQLEPNNQEATTLLAHARSAGGNPTDAVAALQKSIIQQSANGAKAPRTCTSARSSLPTRRSLQARRRSAVSGWRPIPRRATGGMRSASIAISTASTKRARSTCFAWHALRRR